MPKFFWTKNRFYQIFFGSKIFWTQIFLDTNFLSQNLFRPNFCQFCFFQHVPILSSYLCFECRHCVQNSYHFLLFRGAGASGESSTEHNHPVLGVDHVEDVQLLLVREANSGPREQEASTRRLETIAEGGAGGDGGEEGGEYWDIEVLDIKM